MPRGCYYLYPGHKHHSSMFLTWKGEGGINIILCCLWREKCLISSHNAIYTPPPTLLNLQFSQVGSTGVGRISFDHVSLLQPSWEQSVVGLWQVKARGSHNLEMWSGSLLPSPQPLLMCLPKMASVLTSLLSPSSLLPFLFIAPPPPFPPLGIFTLGQSKARWHDFSVFPQDNEPGGFHWGTDMQVYIKWTSLFNVKES